MKEKLLKIINHYGVMPQLKYLQSEVFELTEAIITYEIDYKSLDIQDMTDDKNHIAEEIADVLVMLAQFVEYYGISNEDLEKITNYKVERQLKRIEEGKWN